MGSDITAILPNPIQDGSFRGCSRMVGAAKRLPLPKICHRYPKIMKLGTVVPYLTFFESLKVVLINMVAILMM